MKNKLPDLNNHLFMQLERLNEEGISDDAIAREAKRAEHVVAISDQIIGVAKVRLAAAKLSADYGLEVDDVVRPMIEKKSGL